MTSCPDPSTTQRRLTQPRISLVVALAHHRVIGRGNRLPWHLPADLAHFRQLTLDKPILMGRRTWESLPGRLERRYPIVVTRDRTYRIEGATVVASPDEAIAATNAAEIMVIGGAALYQAMLPLAQRIHLTEIDAAIDGDTFFPEIQTDCWREVARRKRPRDARNPYDLDFVELERIRPDSNRP